MVVSNRNRISTGLKGLDKLIDGGFKQGSINLVTGNPGSGKTTMSMQFLMEGLKIGESVIYITFEGNKQKIYDDFIDFGWELERYERMGLLKFLEYTPEQIRRVVVEGGGTLEILVSQLNAKRIVIDSITSFLGLFKSEIDRREASLSLFDMIDKWSCTALLTSQATQVSSDELEAEIEFEVDSILVLHHMKKQGKRERALEVIKMRGTKIPEKTMKMTIDKKGIVIDANKVVST
jgi:circadian clock protein KaiC